MKSIATSLLVLLSIQFLSMTIWASTPRVRCERLYYPEIQRTPNLLEFRIKSISPEHRIFASQTVEVIGPAERDGHLLLKVLRAQNLYSKSGDLVYRPWFSAVNLVRGTITPQGDPRSFIFAAGPRLAELFGFKLERRGDDYFLTIPDAPTLEQTILRLNSNLLKQGLRPIAYLPVRAGILGKGEILKLANTFAESILVHFPYADTDFKILVHEVSYHLGQILFPFEIHQRVNELNLEFEGFSKLILQANLPSARKVSFLVGESREIEMDIGYGNLHSATALLRDYNDFAPYSEIDTSPMEPSILPALQNLYHPSLNRRGVIISRIIEILDLREYFADHPELLYDHKKGSAVWNWFGKVALTIPQRLEWARYLKSQLSSEPAPYDGQSAEVAVSNLKQDFMKQTDLRIREITEAFEEPKQSLEPNNPALIKRLCSRLKGCLHRLLQQ